MKIAIVDYGMGNLHSVLKSAQTAQKLADVNAEIVLTDQPEIIFAADKVIFPGQGAMPDCMSALQKSGLREAVADGLKNKPFFGICVGAQLLFEHSEEGDTAGLGWFGGEVKRFAANQHDAAGTKLKIPHMGWNNVYQTQAHPLFKDINQDTRFYFVHSYYVQADNQRQVAGSCEYGLPFAAALADGPCFAVQFHPEKSHTNGLQLLQNFVAWDGRW